MNDQEKLNSYIYRQLQAGLQPEEIAQQLRTAGWDEATIARSFEAARATLTPLAQPMAPPAQPMVTSPSSQSSPIVQQMATGPAVSFAPTGQKRGRIKTGWLLLKQSMKVLLHNKQLIRYPFMGGLMSLLLTIIFAVIVIAGHSIFLVNSVDSAGKSVWTANLLRQHAWCRLLCADILCDLPLQRRARRPRPRHFPRHLAALQTLYESCLVEACADLLLRHHYGYRRLYPTDYRATLQIPRFFHQ